MMMSKKSFIKRLVFTALTAGTLDIAAAMLNFFISTGKNPEPVLRFIASGVFGKDAFSDNAWMPYFGLFFHYCIATTWTILFFMAYPKIKLLSKNWIVSGSVYAVVVWILMTYVVLPLSNVPQLPFDLVKALVAIAILIVCIGMPISYSAKKYFSSAH